MPHVSESLDVEELVRAEQGLYTWLVRASTVDPNRVVARSSDGETTVEVTLAELLAKSRQLAEGLRSIEMTEGSTIAVWLPNQVEWIISQFACAALGVAMLGLNTRYRSHEVSHLLSTVPIAALIVPSEFLGIDFVGTLSEAVRHLRVTDPGYEPPSLVFVGEIPEAAMSVASNVFRFQDLLTVGTFDEVRDFGHALSNLFTTSGSTSAPKVAGHDQASILRHGCAGSKALGVEIDDRMLAVLPLCGVFGYSAAMAILIGGGSLVLVESFDAEFSAQLLADLGVTHVVGGDEMLGAIFSKITPGTNLPKLRRGGIANFAGRAKEVVVQAQERWGAAISGVYGSSELFALSAIWPATADVKLRGLGGGFLVDPGIHVRVGDLDTDTLVPDGEPGELQFLGYNVIDGYLNNPAANASSFSKDGWFKTGDLGYTAHGGFVYQCRAREAMRLRGFLVEPGEIEDFLSSEPSIEEVHVVGVDTDEGTKAFAFVRARSGSTIDEASILGRAKSEMAGFKVPERVIEVEEFPTTTGTNGTKVRFDELRNLARTYLSDSS